MYPIPANATRIRYLESTGTQYVDTGVQPGSAFEFSARLAVRSLSGTTGLIGCRNPGVTNQTYNAWIQSGKVRGDTTGLSNWFVSVEADVPFDYIYNQTQTSINGQTKANSDHVALARNFLLGTFLNNTTPYAGAPQRIFSASLFQSSVLVRSYVPLRIGSVGYLFDRVSGQLFGNAGTGDFVLGPDTFAQGVVPTRMMAMGVHDALPYTREIEYLEGTGTQYIDTGVLIGPTTRIESSFACTSSSRPKTASLYYVTEQSPKINGVRTNNSGYLIAVVGGVGNQNGYDPISPRTIKTVTDFSTGYVFIRLQQGDSYIRDMSKTGSPLSEANTISMYIFANNNGGVANSFGAFRFMSMRVWESGVLVRDFVPVRVGQVGYLFDKVSKQLFGNAGTGSFVLGPDK